MKSLKARNVYMAAAIAVLFVVSVQTIVIGKPILAPLAFSFLMAFVLTPIVRYLEGKGIPRLPAVAIITLAAFGLFIGLSLPSSRSFVNWQPSYRPMRKK